MCFIQMTTLAHPKRLNVMEQVRPGMVASVGDTLVVSQFARSMPDLPPRFDPNFYSTQESNGSKMTSQPYVSDSAWAFGRSEQVAYGMMQQDLRAPDRLHEPTLQSTPQNMWNNQVATVYQSKRTGNKFLPLPGGYQVARGEMVRGGQVVRTTDIEGLYSVVQSQQPSPSVGLARRNNQMAMRSTPMSMGIVDSNQMSTGIDQIKQ
jgi:hypothetical protein